MTHDEREVSAETKVIRKPAALNNEAGSPGNQPLNEAPATDEPPNSEADGNQQ